MDDMDAAAAIADSLGYIPLSEMDPTARGRFVKAAAAARAALTGPKVTREEVDKWNARIAGFTESESMVDHILAALRHFARAPGGKVPEIPEIIAEFRKYTTPEKMACDIMIPRHEFHCARVAHAMMTKLGGRPEMAIYGMSEDEITAVYREKFHNWNPIAVVAAASLAYRLATTPRTVVDADKETKELAYTVTKTYRPDVNLRDAEDCWTLYDEPQRELWRRAVAAAKGKADE